MDRSEIEQLAARCEAAEGPDRELDAEIAVAALGMVRDGDEFWTEGESYSITEPDYYALVGQVSELAYFTASLDAALTLVPEGHEYSLGSGRRKAGNPEHVSPWARVFPNADAINCQLSMAATPALALCAAALKARAALGGDN